MKDWIELIIALLGGGVVGTIATYSLGKRKDDRDGLKDALALWQADNERLRVQEKLNAETLLLLQKELANLRAKMSMLEYTQIDFPFPMWFKDMDGTMLSVNSHYEKEFLFPLAKTSFDYVGHTDFAIWPKERAEEYQKNDKYVIQTKKVWDGEELIERYGALEKHRVIKYIRYAAGIPIGIAGIAFPLKNENNAQAA